MSDDNDTLQKQINAIVAADAGADETETVDDILADIHQLLEEQPQAMIANDNIAANADTEMAAEWSRLRPDDDQNNLTHEDIQDGVRLIYVEKVFETLPGDHANPGDLSMGTVRALYDLFIENDVFVAADGSPVDNTDQPKRE